MRIVVVNNFFLSLSCLFFVFPLLIVNPNVEMLFVDFNGPWLIMALS